MINSLSPLNCGILFCHYIANCNCWYSIPGKTYCSFRNMQIVALSLLKTNFYFNIWGISLILSILKIYVCSFLSSCLISCLGSRLQRQPCFSAHVCIEDELIVYDAILLCLYTLFIHSMMHCGLTVLFFFLCILLLLFILSVFVYSVCIMCPVIHRFFFL